MTLKKNSNPIDKDKVSSNPKGLEFPHHVGSAPVKPEDKGKLKSRSIESMNHQTDMQMQQIYEQMHLLAEQANKLKDRKVISEMIYTAEMRFEPLINHTYHLYAKNEGMKFLSLIDPKSWKNPNIYHIASVKLLADYTWDILEKTDNWDFNE